MGAPEKKCALCSYPIRDVDLVVVEQGDLFHKPCWRLIESNTLIVDSRRLQNRSPATHHSGAEQDPSGPVDLSGSRPRRRGGGHDDPDRGAQTLVLQAQLEVHQAECAGCRREIDVPQLAL